MPNLECSTNTVITQPFGAICEQASDEKRHLLERAIVKPPGDFEIVTNTLFYGYMAVQGSNEHRLAKLCLGGALKCGLAMWRIGASCGLVPPLAPAQRDQAYAALWSSKGFAQHQVNWQSGAGVADLIERTKASETFVRLIVGGIGFRDPSIPVVYENLHPPSRVQYPTDINLNIDAYGSPHIWGNVGSSETLNLFPAESIRSVVFECVGSDSFDPANDMSESDCIIRLRNGSLPQKSAPEYFVSATKAASILPGLARLLETGGHLYFLGAIPPVNIWQSFLFQQVRECHFVFDVVGVDSEELIAAIVQQKSGQPVFCASEPTRAQFLLLTKQAPMGCD